MFKGGNLQVLGRTGVWACRKLQQWSRLSELVCPFTVVLPRIFFSLPTLSSYPVFFSLFPAPLDVVVRAGQWAGPLDLYGKEDAPALHASPSYG